jgi:hypothetical protein
VVCDFRLDIDSVALFLFSLARALAEAQILCVPLHPFSYFPLARVLAETQVLCVLVPLFSAYHVLVAGGNG